MGGEHQAVYAGQRKLRTEKIPTERFSIREITGREHKMLQTVEGRYENGRVVIRETPAGVRRARVLVTFIDEEVGETAEALPFRTLSPAERAARVATIQRQWATRLSSSEDFARAKEEELALEERTRGGRDG